jgi:hypothetical protein
MGGNIRNGGCIGIVHCAHGSFFNSDQRDRNQPGRFEPESNGYSDGKPVAVVTPSPVPPALVQHAVSLAVRK